MGKLLGNEFRYALPPGGQWLLSRSFPKRQVRRCPYLFSVAPRGYRSGMSKALNPPSREGFPETHTLLNECWKRYLKDMETILTEQPYLLGNQFTIADASAYGQLGMNLVDPQAAKKLKEIAPLTFDWLNSIHQQQHCKASHKAESGLYLSKALKPLLNTIMNTFSALMIQNAQAYELAKQDGATLFNEAAFNRDMALYDGKLRGYPFRSVVKTFQVRVWQDICEKWRALSALDKAKVRKYVPLCDMFDR